MFNLPRSACGKDFICEKTTLVNCWVTKSADRDICIKALMVMPNLLLQKTEGGYYFGKISKINNLVDEGCSMQNRLSHEGKKIKLIQLLDF